MSTIQFTFDDLCAVFTRHTPHVMVGLLDTADAPPDDIHHPHIIIEEEGGAIVGEYHGFNYHGYAQIYGDIFLDVFPDAPPLTWYAPITAPGLSDTRQPFTSMIDIERMLYPQQPLDVRSDRCRARLHFRNGELYARGPLHSVSFADVTSGALCETVAATPAASSVGLDVTVPDHGYAVLHFNGNTQDFVFKGGRNYKVTVTNAARTFTSQHFQYFYRLADQSPAHRFIPTSATPVVQGCFSDGGPLCMPGWFAMALYYLLVQR